MKTYKIIRMKRYGSNEVISTGLTLEEAQSHCRRDDTHGEGWFDGYEEESPSEATLEARRRKDAGMEDREEVCLCAVCRESIYQDELVGHTIVDNKIYKNGDLDSIELMHERCEVYYGCED